MYVKEAIEKRRSYRSFEPVEITDDLIKDLARVAQIAPSCNNNQPWNFIFVFNEDKMKKLHKTLSKNNAWVKKASMMIGVFSKPDMDCRIKEREYYLFDMGLASAFIMLRATELNLIAHAIAGFDEKKAKEILKIPKEMRLITFINIGKHSEDINPELTEDMKLGERQRPPRKDLDEFIYMNEFKK
jgi:nitroreductase